MRSKHEFIPLQHFVEGPALPSHRPRPGKGSWPPCASGQCFCVPDKPITTRHFREIQTHILEVTAMSVCRRVSKSLLSLLYLAGGDCSSWLSPAQAHPTLPHLQTWPGKDLQTTVWVPSLRRREPGLGSIVMGGDVGQGGEA